MTLYTRLLRAAGRWTYLGRVEEELRQRRLGSVPRSVIRAGQLERLNELWAYAAARIPHYRDLSRSRSLPTVFSSLEEFTRLLPPLTRREVQASPARFLSPDAGPGFWVRTGGSTGQPLQSFRSRAAHRWMRLDTHYQRQQFGVAWYDPWLLLWGGGDGFREPGLTGLGRRLKNRAKDRLKNRRRVNAYQLDTAGLETCRRLLLRRPIRLLYAYSMSALRLASYCSLHPPFPRPGLVVLSAEPAAEEEIDFMKQVFQCPVVREYGAVEMGLIAVDLPGAPLRVMEQSVFLETLPGEAGLFEILCTNLHNRDFPLLRYHMGDLTSRPMQTEPTGPSSLADVIGRRNDMIFLPPDRWIHPLSLVHLVHRTPDILRIQVIVESSLSIRIRLERPYPLGGTEKQMMIRRIRGLLGKDVRVAVAENVPFETTSLGKHRFVIQRSAPGAG